MAIAIGSYIGPPLIHKGIKLPIVVAVVSTIGRIHRCAASIMAS